MKELDYWKVFEQTGSVGAYLQYACTMENGRNERREKDRATDESGEGYRDGAVSRASWRLR